MLSLWKILANKFLQWKTYERVAREKLSSNLGYEISS